MNSEAIGTLRSEVIVASRESGISYTLFRNAIGKGLRLNTTDFEGLDLIFFRGAATPSELSRYTGLSSGSTTAMIDRLEKAGMVKRQSNPHDRRGTLVVVDKDAACKVGPLFTSARVGQTNLMARYTHQELEVLLDFFQRSRALYEDERKKL